MNNLKINKFIPKELLRDNTSVKRIEPPKGKILAKSAFDLENRISEQINSNNANILRQNMHIMQMGKHK